VPKYREALSDDLAEFVGICRAGKLFAAEEWIRSGRRFRCPDGNFHSLVEVLLRAGIDQDEKAWALSHAVSNRRLDLIELLAE
jgi:hypothetical protein